MTSDSNWTYTYDDEGNRISKTNSTNTERELYTWDYRNRLTSVTKQTYNAETGTWENVQIVEYAYDYNNVWIRKVLDSNGDGTADSKTIFIPENYQTVAQINNGTVSHYYLWTPNQQDKLLADVTTNDVLWALTDHLGTIRDIIQSTESGVIPQAHIIYDAYGNVISCKNSEGQTVDNPLLFAYTGKPFDVSTQLQNNINRWYDPATGRWLSTDPIGFEGNDTNLYRYVKNQILLKLDYYGLEDFWEHDAGSWLKVIGKETRRQQRNEILNKGKQMLLNCINSKESCLSEKEKNNALALFDQIIAIARNTPNETYINGCEKWAMDFEASFNALQKSSLVKAEMVTFDYILYRGLYYFIMPKKTDGNFLLEPLRHVVIKIQICGKTAFYLDNGWWNHIFDRIPVTVVVSKPQTSFWDTEHAQSLQNYPLYLPF